MLIKQFTKMFLGHTPLPHRLFLKDALGRLRQQFPKVQIPCAGQFSLVRMAIEAGYKPEQITASDITLYSSALGFFLAGKPLERLGFVLAEEVWLPGQPEPVPLRALYEAESTEVRRLAVLFWAMKVLQLRQPGKFYTLLREDLIGEREHHVAHLAESLTKMKPRYAGLRYHVRDMRALIREDCDAETVLVVNPPGFAKGYEKMFPIEGAIDWDPEIDQFDPREEYLNLYGESRALPGPAFWIRVGDVDGIEPTEVVFAREFTEKMVKFVLCTKPGTLDVRVETGKNRDARPYKHLAIRNPTKVLTPDMTVQMLPVKEEHGVYYRDLWAHRLGHTQCTNHYLLLIDGEISGAVGFYLRDLFMLNNDFAWESFGFSAPSDVYPNIGRLLMTIITAQEMGDVLRRTTAKKNRLWTVRGIRTTCLSKYRDVKLNKGLLELESTKKDDNGMWHTVWRADFRPETFQQALARYLREFEERYAGRLRTQANRGVAAAADGE